MKNIRRKYYSEDEQSLMERLLNPEYRPIEEQLTIIDTVMGQELFDNYEEGDLYYETKGYTHKKRKKKATK